MRAFMCRRGVERMCADADEAAQRFAAHGIVTPGPALLKGIAHVLSGDLFASDAFLADAVIAAESTSAHEVLAAALSERSLLAMTHGEWSRAEDLAGQASTALREAGIEESYVAPLVCAARARLAVHRGDVAAARRQLAHAQRLRPVLTYAIPHVAVQALVGLTRVQLALADIAGARTLMREIDELLARRPDLGTLVGEAQALRDRLSASPDRSVPGASSLTAAELRVLPLLATHLSFQEIGAELYLSPHTVKSQAISIYRKLGATSRSQAVARSRELALLEG
jgi:LuxR family maltose regulon positive regulatory protein